MNLTGLNEYQELAGRTAPADLTFRDMLLNMSIGISGESGELADCVKKYVYHGHEFDREAMAKELGDCMWYIANLAEVLNYDLSEVAEMNIEKLKKRYPVGFSTVDSIKPTATVLKLKGETPSVLEIGGQRYILDTRAEHKRDRRKQYENRTGRVAAVKKRDDSQ